MVHLDEVRPLEVPYAGRNVAIGDIPGVDRVEDLHPDFGVMCQAVGGLVV